MAKLNENPGGRWRAMPAWLVPVAMLAVVAFTYFAVALLLHLIKPPASTDPLEAAKLRVETIRTGLTVGAGAAGAVLLLLTARRQWHAEQTQLATEHDATERRVTELYVKAAEQLGSDRAAVRLASLYALERLAQDNPGHRSTVIDLLCAYLRMPFTSPNNIVLPPDATDEVVARHAAAREELEVRTTVQRILHRHFQLPIFARPTAITFWGGKDVGISLVGATLIDFQFSDVELGYADFSEAIFERSAWFTGCHFNSGANFVNAIFDTAHFQRSNLGAISTFSNVKFRGVADFSDIRVKQGEFEHAEFHEEAMFDGANFGEREDHVSKFIAARFDSYSSFAGAEFQSAEFSKANFAGDARFIRSRFMYGANFDGCTFHHHANFRHAHLGGGHLFITATLKEGADLMSAVFKPGFFGDSHLPTGWTRGQPTDESGELFTATSLVPQPREPSSGSLEQSQRGPGPDSET